VPGGAKGGAAASSESGSDQDTGEEVSTRAQGCLRLMHRPLLREIRCAPLSVAIRDMPRAQGRSASSVT
jgi:hypothetical protein